MLRVESDGESAYIELSPFNKERTWDWTSETVDGVEETLESGEADDADDVREGGFGGVCGAAGSS